MNKPLSFGFVKSHINNNNNIQQNNNVQNTNQHHQQVPLLSRQNSNKLITTAIL